MRALRLTALGIVAAAAFPAAASAAQTVNLDQCANGAAATPEVCSGSAWINGNLNETKSHYAEDDVVPFRAVFSGLAAGEHTVTIRYATTKDGKHAYDYLASYDKTESGAEPCGTGGPTCPAGVDTESIPEDPALAGHVASAAHAGDVFTLWGGTIDSVSAYAPAGDPAGDSSNGLTITFTSTDPNPVLAWGGHIASHLDWGPGSSAAAIPGSPWHMSLDEFDGGPAGAQDRSLKAVERFFGASLTVVEDSTPDGQLFGFTASGAGMSGFSLGEGIVGEQPSRSYTFPTADDLGTKVVTQSAVAGWPLTALSCTETRGQDSSADLGAATATAVLEEGEHATCTFVNTQDAPEIPVIPETPGEQQQQSVAVAIAQQIASAQSRNKPACKSRRSFSIRIREYRDQKLRSARISVNGKHLVAVRGARLRAPVKLKGLPKGRVVVRIKAVTTTGKKVSGKRVYHPCTPKRKHTVPSPL